MIIARRLRKARACVDVAKTELIDLHTFFLDSLTPYRSEARAINEMQKQLIQISSRLENMAKHHDVF